ncbi:2113_t:CDS:2 [Entrophospora sp. SA101]|nr:5056_t:CDS:2 [Entrophospora sp. SA101]CAJ0833908.1 2113_t:CDS:2 [Entrophospora sp. SA101]
MIKRKVRDNINEVNRKRLQVKQIRKNNESHNYNQVPIKKGMKGDKLMVAGSDESLELLEINEW